jgi:ribonuclease HII
MTKDCKLIIGIDEAGRGPLAGPVTVGVFCAEDKMKNKLIKILGGRVRDSKQLSPAKRESIFKILNEMKMNSQVDFSVAHSSPKMIDKIGISKCIKNGIKKCLNKITHPQPLSYSKRGEMPTIRLDGGLKAPAEFTNQKTIIRGDATDPFIACASIVAKVSRDRLMCRLAKKFPEYRFEIHKGYGTAAHRALIKKHGVSDLHRVTFCGNI